jgi:uncharacterized protein
MTMDEAAMISQGLPAGSRMILRATVGSTVHGTSLDGASDRDEVGIVLEPMTHVIGLQHWETLIVRTQPDGVRSQPGDLDLTLYSLRKYCRLTARGNPTMLLPLFAPDDACAHLDALGKELRAKRDMFVSRDAGESFIGYMHAQRARMTGERGSRHGKPRAELIERYGYDTKYAGHIMRLGLQGIELMATGALSLPMCAAHRDLVLAVRRGEHDLTWVANYTGKLEHELRDAVEASELPEHADHAAIDHFLIDAYSRAWGLLWHRIEPSAYETTQNAILDAAVR